jgi:hypothetical protein
LKGREFAKLARRHLMPHLPGFALKDGRIYAVPVGRLWRAFTLYPSGFSRDRFTMYCVVAPLYKPEAAGAVLPGLGDRLPVLAGRGDAWWQWRPDDDEAEAQLMADIRGLILETGVPFLGRLATVEDVARRLSRERDHRTDPHTAEALAYSLIMTGEYKRARQELAVLRQITLEDEERAQWWSELNAGTSREDEEDWSSRSANAARRFRRRLRVRPTRRLRCSIAGTRSSLRSFAYRRSTSKVKIFAGKVWSETATLPRVDSRVRSPGGSARPGRLAGLDCIARIRVSGPGVGLDRAHPRSRLCGISALPAAGLAPRKLGGSGGAFRRVGKEIRFSQGGGAGDRGRSGSDCASC